MRKFVFLVTLLLPLSLMLGCSSGGKGQVPTVKDDVKDGNLVKPKTTEKGGNTPKPE